MSSSVSIKEIAELAGVSIATVSRVVNQKGGYSAATEERVRDNHSERPVMRRVLLREVHRNVKKAVVGLMVPDILNEHFTEMTHWRFRIALSRKGYLTMICNWDESLELEKKYLEMMIQQQVSGLILVSGADGNLDTKGNSDGLRGSTSGRRSDRGTCLCGVGQSLWRISGNERTDPAGMQKDCIS